MRLGVHLGPGVAGSTVRSMLNGLLVDDVLAEDNALVADVDIRSSDELPYLVLRLPRNEHFTGSLEPADFCFTWSRLLKRRRREGRFLK